MDPQIGEARFLQTGLVDLKRGKQALHGCARWLRVIHLPPPAAAAAAALAGAPMHVLSERCKRRTRCSALLSRHHNRPAN